MTRHGQITNVRRVLQRRNIKLFKWILSRIKFPEMVIIDLQDSSTINFHKQIVDFSNSWAGQQNPIHQRKFSSSVTATTPPGTSSSSTEDTETLRRSWSITGAEVSMSGQRRLPDLSPKTFQLAHLLFLLPDSVRLKLSARNFQRKLFTKILSFKCYGEVFNIFSQTFFPSRHFWSFFVV